MTDNTDRCRKCSIRCEGDGERMKWQLLAFDLTPLAVMIMFAVQLMAPQSGNGVIGPRAVLKVLLHMAKHPHAQVMGLLVGPKDSTVIDDAVPLFHHPPEAPLLETAFMLVEQWAEASGLRFAGLYYAPIDTPLVPEKKVQSKPSLCPVMAALGDKVDQLYPGAKVVRVRCERLGDSQADEDLLEGWSREGGSWGVDASMGAHRDGVRAFDGYHKTGHEGMEGVIGMTALVDFDDHLDNATHDFLANDGAEAILRQG